MQKIELEKFVDELELISDEGISFFNKTTGHMFHVSDEEYNNAKRIIKNKPTLSSEKLGKIRNVKEVIESNDYITLPGKKDLDEFNLMKNFCLSFSNKSIEDEVLDLLKKGNGTIWNLMQIISKYNIGDEWYKFKRKKFLHLVVEWCNKNKI